MRRTLNLVILLMPAFTAMADNDMYKEYCQLMKEKRNLTFSVPENAVSFQSEGSLFVFSFGERVEGRLGRKCHLQGQRQELQRAHVQSRQNLRGGG